MFGPRLLKDLFAALLLGALVLRGLLPAGFMPDAERGGIMLCTGSGLVEQDPGSAGGGDAAPEHQGAACPLAAAGGTAPPPACAVFTACVTSTLPADAARHLPIAVPGLALRPWSRGPPRLS